MLVALLAAASAVAGEWLTIPGPEGPLLAQVHPEIVYLGEAPEKSLLDKLEPLESGLKGFFRLPAPHKSTRAQTLEALAKRFPNRAPVLKLGERGEAGWAILDRQVVVTLKPGQSPQFLAARAHEKLQPIPFLEHTYVVTPASPDAWAGLAWAQELARHDAVHRAWVSLQRPRSLRTLPNDPLFNDQWHLANTGQFGGSAGNDIHILPAWESFLGAGIRVAIVDEGVEHDHPDLVEGVDLALSYDYLDDDTDPSPADGEESHGTAIAGLIGATQNNGVGVSGVAPLSTMAALRSILPASTDSIEALALGHLIAPESGPFIHVSANAWGPSDAGAELGPIGPLARAAIEAGITNGRNGKGIIYIWAGGNGRRNLDNVNYDAYANSRYTIAVGATGPDGLVAGYSEPGAALLVNAPGSKDGIGIITTDQSGSAGYSPGSYTSVFGGTSAASAIAAGVVALILEANPDLSWRDMQHLLIQSATQNEPESPAWHTNEGGYTFHHDYGFGRIDAAAAISLAADFESVPDSAPTISFVDASSHSIPDNNSTGITLLAPMTTPPGFFLEHVEVTVDIEHERRGDLELVLISPSGVEARLAEFHNDNNPDYANWTFMSVATWGESGEGTWSLRVRDLQAGNTGALNRWQLSLHGFAAHTGEGEGNVPLVFHSADTDESHQISLSELLRVVQLYNSGQYGCAEATEDGYGPGPLPQDCATHDSDYRPADWSIRLTEILRLIQLYNVGGYYACVQGEDGFCAGSPNSE